MFDRYITYQARMRPLSAAVVRPDGVVNFAHFDESVSRAAKLLLNLKAAADTPVAVDIEDSYLNWLVTLALARIGVPSAPAADQDCMIRVADIAKDGATLTLRTSDIASILFGRAQASSAIEVPQNGIGRIILSSGTTGREKRIALSWRGIDASIRNVPLAYGSPVGPWMMTTGAHTILGFVLTLGCWALGKPILLIDKQIDGPSLAHFRPGLLAMTPKQLAYFVDRLPNDFSKQAVRIVLGGSNVPRALLARIRRTVSDDVLAVYGTSESGSVAVATGEALLQDASAVGFVLPGVKIRIIDRNGAEVEPGSPGRISVRSDRMASHYLRGPSDALTGGWLSTGDIGRIGAGGLLYVCGREDDLINIGGDKISPFAIESAIDGIPGIVDAAAYSISDTDGSEHCWIAIEGTADFEECSLQPALAKFAHIIGTVNWLRVDRLPRNATGKIDRISLKNITRSFIDRRNHSSTEIGAT